jgi:hypothetical protein
MAQWLNGTCIQSLEHLRWGLYRLYLDALLFFGNIRSGYRYLRAPSETELADYFESKRVDTLAVKNRGPALPLVHIPRDDRYLVAKQACKSYAISGNGEDMKAVLVSSLKDHLSRGGGNISIRALLDGSYVQQQLC